MMALSSGVRVPSLKQCHKVLVSGDEKAPSYAATSSTYTTRVLFRELQAWDSRGTGRSSCARISLLGSGQFDGNLNSVPRRKIKLSSSSSSHSSPSNASAATTALLFTGSGLIPGGAPAGLLRRRDFLVDRCQIELRRSSRSALQWQNQNLGSRAESNEGEGVVLDDVPHLSHFLPNLPRYPNPLVRNPAYRAVRQYFVEEDDVVSKNVVVKLDHPADGICFRRAGPRENVCFTGDEVRACIVTCGGLCPGLNTVIREIVCGLWTSYDVRDIIGIDGGYAGFYSNNTIQLTPKFVNDIHKRGGTILGTSRGGHDKTKIVAAILDRGINQVYIIGGDGTQRGAAVIYEELKKLGVKVVVAGIPKTIDNDIAVIDKSFGFDTAVEEAQRAINAAHVEAESVKNGVGLVKLMGRYSGYIAMYATLASRDVDCCLIPEVPFYLEGEGGLYEFTRRRLRENGHMVIVVAEGAGQELIAESTLVKESDASGNRLLLDVGLWLSHNLKNHFAGNKKEAITLKYIDPTYMVRAIPSNASDNVYCTLLAHSAMHGAMAGYTGFTVGPVNGRHAYIPIATAVETQNNVNITDRMWARLLSSTQQPNFLEYHSALEEKKKAISELLRAPHASITNGAVPQEITGDGGFKSAHLGADEFGKSPQEKL